jgi:hypothetical protein
MKRIMIFLVIIMTLSLTSNGQVYFTKNASISFFSKAILENIQADNNQVISVLNIQTGVIQFSLLNNAFHFPKAKMEEDFNEDYIESDKYPRSTFKGIITDISKINFIVNGTWRVNVNGDLMIHGVKKNITLWGTITVKDGKISAAASFKIIVKDYDINIPSIVANKIAENIDISVFCNYEIK